MINIIPYQWAAIIIIIIVEVVTFTMKILGKIDLRTILYFGVSEILITIILCYVLAVTLQHQPVWLPTISECGELSPEKYFFRWGILVGGLLLVIESTVLRAADRISTITFYAGVLAGLCLTGVAVVASNENLPVHLGKLVNSKTITWPWSCYMQVKQKYLASINNVRTMASRLFLL